MPNYNFITFIYQSYFEPWNLLLSQLMLFFIIFNISKKFS
jgi:hypothetical protein